MSKRDIETERQRKELFSLIENDRLFIDQNNKVLCCVYTMFFFGSIGSENG